MNQYFGYGLAVLFSLAGGSAAYLLTKKTDQPTIEVAENQLSNDSSSEVAAPEVLPEEPAAPQTAPTKVEVEQPDPTPAIKVSEPRSPFGYPFASQEKKNRIITSWTIQAPGEDGVTDDYRIKKLSISNDGKTVFTKSPAELACRELNTGTALHRFPMEFRTNPSISPDGRIVGIPSQDFRSVQFYQARSGRRMYSYSANETQFFHDYHAAITIDGNNLVQWGVGTRKEISQFHKISFENGQGSPLPLSRLDPKLEPKYLLVNEQEQVMFTQIRSDTKPYVSSIVIINMNDGSMRKLTSVKVDPWNILQQGFALSPNGKHLLVNGLKELQVVDWQADRSVCSVALEKTPSFSLGQMTPDGEKIVVVWQPNYSLIGAGYTKKVPWKLQVYDAKAGSLLSQYETDPNELTEDITALQVAPDGKSVVVASGRRVYQYDWAAIFE